MTNAQQLISSEETLNQIRKKLLRKSVATLKQTRITEETRKEIMDWIDNTGSEPFSFNDCCASQDLDPVSLREGIKMSLRRMGFTA